MAKNRPSTKILVDGGDPEETARIRNLLGFLDGQTTNPTLVAKNPEVQERIASGHKLSREEQTQEYKKIVQSISPLCFPFRGEIGRPGGQRNGPCEEHQENVRGR